MKTRTISTIVIFLLATSTCLKAQNFYTPGGKLIGRLKSMSVRSVNSKLGLKYVTVDSSTNTGHMAGFKILTNIPVWVLCDSVAQIQPTINAFKYEKYLSTAIEADFDKMIKDDVLTELYLSTVFGPPRDISRSTKVQNAEVYVYKKLKYRFIMVKGKVESYVK